MISIKELHGVDAWRYLMESVTDGQGDLRDSAAITRYFTDAGTPPGRWLGSGLAGLAAGAGLMPGALVAGEHMELLFGHGRDPVTGEKLGRGFRAPRSYRERGRRTGPRPSGQVGERRAHRADQGDQDRRADQEDAPRGCRLRLHVQPSQVRQRLVGPRRSRRTRTDHRRPPRRNPRRAGAARTRRRPHPGRHRPRTSTTRSSPRD